MTKKYETILQCPYTGEVEIRDGVKFASAGPLCGCQSGMTAIETNRLWQGCRENIRVYFDPTDAPVTATMPTNADYRTAFRSALIRLQESCGVRFVLVDDPAKAEIKVGFRFVGRGILGISGVGGSCDSFINQSYGTQWDWQPARFTTVVMHEMGHALGLGHSVCRANGQFVLMCWQIQQDLEGPDPLTSKFLQEAYGPPLDAPVDPEPEPPIPQPEPTPEPAPQPQPPEDPPMNPLERILQKLLERIFQGDILDKLLDRLIEVFLENILNGMDESSAAKAAASQVMRERASLK